MKIDKASSFKKKKKEKEKKRKMRWMKVELDLRNTVKFLNLKRPKPFVRMN